PTPTTSSTSVEPTPTPSSTSVEPTPTLSSTSVEPTPTPSSTSVEPTPTPSSTSVEPTPTPTSSSSVEPTPTTTSISVAPTSSTSVEPTPTPSSTSVEPTPTTSSTSIEPTPTPSSTSVEPTPTPTPSSSSVEPTPTTISTSVEPTRTSVEPTPTTTSTSSESTSTTSSTSVEPTPTSSSTSTSSLPLTETVTPTSSTDASTSSTSSTVAPSPTGPALNDRVLVISKAGDEATVVNTLQKYNTPYDIVYTDSTGFVTPLPALSSGTTGLYKLVVMTFLPFWNPSALDPLNTYLSTFNVKLVRINDTPDPALGVISATGAGYDNGQSISFAEATFAVSAALSSNSVLSSAGLFHNPANITNSNLASPVLYFDATSPASGPDYQTVAAALIKNPNGGGFQQLSFYLPFAVWSTTSTSLNQVWYSWGMGVTLTVPVTTTSTSVAPTSTTTSAVTVPTGLVLNQRVLIISQESQGHEAAVVSTLNKYNTPYDIIYTNTAGFVSPLPALSSGTTGFYKLVVMTYLPFWNPSALDPLNTYLSSFNAKLVRLNDNPDTELGIDYDVAWTGYDNGQTISFAQDSFATNAGLSSTSSFSSASLYHIPSKITNAAIASPVLYFDAISSGPDHQTVAAALIKNPKGGAGFQQLSFYLPFATWSATSTSLSQVWYSWGMDVTLTAPTPTTTSIAVAVPTSVVLNQKVLVISQASQGQEAPVVNTLVKYNVAYDVIYIDSTGFTTPLPALSSGNTGYYNLVVMTFPSYSNTAALTPVTTYLSTFNAKLVRINDSPDTSLGVDYDVAWTGYDNGQTISFAQTSFATNAGLSSTSVLSSAGLFHVPSKIKNAAIASPVLYFDAIASGPNYQTVAAALIQNPTGGAGFQQLSFYLPFATWSSASTSLNDVWFSWGM
ncbi:hypothetical protein HDU76_007835, partial [Blyttiomyces sp. JEL0837]